MRWQAGSLRVAIAAPRASRVRARHPSLAEVQTRIDETLGRALQVVAVPAPDPRWARALRLLRTYALRPAKRVRPALVLAGHALAGGGRATPGVWRFATGVELLHTFTLVHDDVADRADVRRGGPSLHRALAPGRVGEDLAVIVGDFAFVRALETMLGCGLAGATAATRYYLGVLRDTAAGQYLDVARAPLRTVTPQAALRVACLKTASLGFVAPLVAGALLGGGGAHLRAALRALGREVGVAFQLRDDLLALFGDAGEVGKPPALDAVHGTATFPLVVAYAAAPAEARREIDRLRARRVAPEIALRRVRQLVTDHGGRTATERAIAGATRRARRLLHRLPDGGGARVVLAGLVEDLARRRA